jgi:hypothetical protein
MPCHQLADPLIKNKMISLLKASNNSAWQGDILKVCVIDKDWFLQRHDITGAILARYVHAQVAVKRNGNCWLYHLVTFKQDYINGHFSDMVWYNHGDFSRIPCENIK